MQSKTKKLICSLSAAVQRVTSVVEVFRLSLSWVLDILCFYYFTIWQRCYIYSLSTFDLQNYLKARRGRNGRWGGGSVVGAADGKEERETGREGIHAVKVWCGVDGTKTRGEVEIEETLPPFFALGRDRERWSSPSAKILPAGLCGYVSRPPCCLLPSCLPSLGGKSLFYLIRSHYHVPRCHLQFQLCSMSELERGTAMG